MAVRTLSGSAGPGTGQGADPGNSCGGEAARRHAGATPGGLLLPPAAPCYLWSALGAVRDLMPQLLNALGDHEWLWPVLMYLFISLVSICSCSL